MGRKKIVNSLTGFVHHDKFVGTADEYLFYTVMPSTSRTSAEKLFFDSKDEFEKWQHRHFPGQSYCLFPGISYGKDKMQKMPETEPVSDSV